MVLQVDKLFGKAIKIPRYETPFEAKETCNKLLKDNTWRKEVVEASQQAINNGHRFKDRLLSLQHISEVRIYLLLCYNRPICVNEGRLLGQVLKQEIIINEISNIKYQFYEIPEEWPVSCPAEVFAYCILAFDMYHCRGCLK